MKQETAVTEKNYSMAKKQELKLCQPLNTFNWLK